VEPQPSADLADFSNLLRLAAAGDAAAQTELCQHYERQVRVVARVLLGPALRPHLDTVDILQSVHKSLLIGLRDAKFEIRTPENLVGLASTMVRRKVARKWRHHRRQERALAPNHDGDGLVETLCSLSSRESSPSQEIEFRDELQKLLGSLNETDRQLLEMRLNGQTGDEIARALHIHPIAMRVRWTRLRQRLEKSGIMTDWF
jgi:RNA polymerase sigma factor (sigma-70 family)